MSTAVSWAIFASKLMKQRTEILKLIVDDHGYIDGNTVFIMDDVIGIHKYMLVSSDETTMLIWFRLELKNLVNRLTFLILS